MKTLFLLTVLISVLSIGTPAQASDTFDIATFRPPARWKKQVGEGNVIFNTSNPAKGAYALIVLYQSGRSAGDATSDFKADWQEFVVGQFGIKGAPQVEPVRSAGGWDIIAGGTQFEKDLGPSVVILNTFSGSGAKFSFVAIFNSQEYIPVIEAFISSVSVKKPAAVPQLAPAASNADASILGTWGRNVGAHMTYGDPVAAGMAGYTKDQYTLNADGTYSFVSKTFRMAYDKIILVRESGTYAINGANITIKPQKSVVQAWSKLNGGDKFGKLLTTQNRALETATYRYTKHYFSGIDQWQLVLQADRPTEREGPYSTFTLFQNAWYFSPISPNNPVIELPK